MSSIEVESPTLANGEICRNLTDYEKREVHFYKVYFSGLGAKEKIEAPEEWRGGYPYTDSKGFYAYRIGDHIAYRYELVKHSGIGSFSHVFKALDWKIGREVALKIIKADHSFAPLLEREVRILDFLNRGDPNDSCNVVKLLSAFEFRGHQVMVFEQLFCSLYHVLKSRQFTGLPLSIVKRLAEGILISLEYLKVMDVVHCDLKPENVMLKRAKHSGVKIIDFGWAYMEGSDKVLSSYFQSRYYRSPEVILHGPLTSAVDMWSFGCIVAELASGRPLFAGEDKDDQLARMVEILGIPGSIVFEWEKSEDYFSPDFAPFYCQITSDGGYPPVNVLTGSKSRKGRYRGVPGSKHIRRAMREDSSVGVYSGEFIDFLLRCFAWDPAERMTPSEALCHIWLRGTSDDL